MTNKTEMVSVPRELLERLDFGKDTAVSLRALKELRALLAAPAEDVRAVVEEHAVWVAESDLSTGTKHAFMARGVPLYRRAQRPLVLPEEFSKRTSDDCDEA